MQRTRTPTPALPEHRVLTGNVGHCFVQTQTSMYTRT